ncbi:MAG: phosphoribosylanthranilate isomerase [Bauldia sp.]|nr:phosphoribosylanthranilate isomerase [Bauldia sp.]MCW5717513.1 phosphoribosylanthranilate isomerase [Bauldia sp.]
MAIVVKICGLSEEKTLRAALDAGADLVGFVFHLASPRNVGTAWASKLRDIVGSRAGAVALVVDASDTDLAEIAERVRPTQFQLHGRETPERVAEVKARFGLPVIKSIAVRTHHDLEDVAAYRDAADTILFDAKPPVGALRPGGHGVTFDWTLLSGLAPDLRFMLSGGLHPGNVAEAMAVARPAAVDVSSGVETAPGKKDENLIAAFITEARLADSRLSAPPASVSAA